MCGDMWTWLKWIFAIVFIVLIYFVKSEKWDAIDRSKSTAGIVQSQKEMIEQNRRDIQEIKQLLNEQRKDNHNE